MTVLARSLSAACLSAASAFLRSRPLISMSNTLPWRTLATPSMPSDRSAPSIALPCGSRIPDFRVTVTRAFMAQFVSSFGIRLMHGGRRLFEQPATPRDPPALADQPHGRPERRRRAGDHRDAATLFQRLRYRERAQTATRDEDAFGVLRIRRRFLAERDDVGLALAARLAESQNVEALERQHLASGRLKQLPQTLIHHVGIGRYDGHALGADRAQAVDDGGTHGADRKAGAGAKLLEQSVVRLRPAIEGERRSDHHDGIDTLRGEMLGRRDDRIEGGGIALRRQRAHAHAARNEAHGGIHLVTLVGHPVLGERDYQANRRVFAHAV